MIVLSLRLSRSAEDMTLVPWEPCELGVCVEAEVAQFAHVEPERCPIALDVAATMLPRWQRRVCICGRPLVHTEQHVVCPYPEVLPHPGVMHMENSTRNLSFASLKACFWYLLHRLVCPCMPLAQLEQQNGAWSTGYGRVQPTLLHSLRSAAWSSGCVSMLTLSVEASVRRVWEAVKDTGLRCTDTSPRCRYREGEATGVGSRRYISSRSASLFSASARPHMKRRAPGHDFSHPLTPLTHSRHWPCQALCTWRGKVSLQPLKSSQ